MEKIKRIYQRNKQFISYCFCCFLCSFIRYSLYFFITWISNGIYLLANLIAYIISAIIFYFYVQKLMTLDNKKHRFEIKKLSKFMGFKIIEFIFESFILILLIEKLNLGAFLSKLFSSLITYIFNRTINKLCGLRINFYSKDEFKKHIKIIVNKLK